MARIKRKGKSGAAKNFITRSAAISKLQITLADFRRLCIFKGIFPREPRNKKRANKGSTKAVTFYYAKDIQYLLHEPVLNKFREHKTFAKKLSKALSKNEITDADKLEKTRPKYTLDHLVRERYPSFPDALRDLDDPLNMLFLFANMPATNRVSHRVTKDAAKLTNQWLAYVAKERLIKKVFVSIKGVYYQANVKGQEVRWLVPFKFPTNIPSDIDFKIMLTFLEFYSTMLHFVLFKLYADADLVYPPPVNTEQLKGIGGLSSYVLKSKQEGLNTLLPNEKVSAEIPEQEASTKLSEKDIQRAKDADAQEDEDVVEENVETVELDEFASANKNPGDLLSQPSKYSSPSSTLFSDFTFFVGREVPLDILELCILSAGGKIVSEIALDELKLKNPESYAKLDLSTITHLLVDRPKILNKVAGRTYVQPQWVFDSINKGELVSASQYAVGETLPPHLSPWGDAGNYNPEQPAQGDAEGESSGEEEIEGEELADEDEEEEEDEDLRQQKELELEAAGVKYSDAQTGSAGKKAKKPKKSEEEEEKELKTIMMNKKLKRLYDRMQHGIEKKDSRVEKLAKKRKQIEKTKKQLEKLQ
ncbi:Pescadillo [Metschnikowia bicuspidata var. bicuspidata NRRL YB-4993]|uniref:Pescadillo homolog n=1 Tax=Metschnikowia bicuspidata var. bicuspidata NRRL YB-4993 TaxID=869754 RepID=A0A1A0HIN5_9ASCO|nr:Pescadillo [Metschnikowia bicuspidata var. bicuspidata NRRL YB-4993]OBA23866.1 Pescadillo [Metschnikowia bicuspidata var. bicuspidata NRRL YB-4993]